MNTNKHCSLFECLKVGGQFFAYQWISVSCNKPLRLPFLQPAVSSSSNVLCYERRGLGRILTWAVIKITHGLSPLANYTDRATDICRRSKYEHFAGRGCHVVSVTDP
jgi:hypothetical protein